MIKNYENFVNEGFLDNVISSIEAGIGAFKINKSAEKELDKEKDRAFYSTSANHELSDKSKMTLLVKHLVRRSVILADQFSWDKIAEDEYEAFKVEDKIRTIEEILTEMKELMPKFK